MNALQQSQPHPSRQPLRSLPNPHQARPTPNPSTRSTSPRRRVRRRSIRPSPVGLGAEAVLRLLVNGLLSIAALMTLMNLFPYYWTQQAKLQEVRQQLRATEQEVAELQAKFNRSFDPSQAPSVMREQSGLLPPNQRRVVLTNQDPN